MKEIIKHYKHYKEIYEWIFIGAFVLFCAIYLSEKQLDDFIEKIGIGSFLVLISIACLYEKLKQDKENEKDNT